MATLALAVTAMLILCAAFAQPSAATPPVQPTVGSVALQLGLKVPPRESDPFEVGMSFTGLLEKPETLASYGIADMKEGARVVALRASHTVVIVEADQQEPQRTGRVKLAINTAGRLSAAPRT